MSLCLAARALTAIFLLASASTVIADVINFEDLALAPDSHWNGPDLSGTTTPGPYGGTQYTGQLSSGGTGFVNQYEDAFGSWNGFAYSNETDTTTAGFGNQFSSIVLALTAASGWWLRPGRRRRGRNSSRQVGAGNPRAGQGTGLADDAGVVTR